MEDRNKPNSGVLWTSKEKKNENSPDKTGSITLDAATLAALAKNGGRLSVAAWVKEGAVAGEFLSLAVRPWEDRAEDKPPVKQEAPRRGPGRPKKVVSDDLFND